MLERLAAWLTFRRIAIILAVIAIATFAAYLQHPFVDLDDNYLIYENPAVKALNAETLAHVFSTYDPQLYIPLTFVSWQLTHLFFQLNPFFYHLGNLLLHAASAVLVFTITTRLSRNRWIGMLTALLFAIHPLQTEVLLWATGRKDALSGFFFLTSLASYMRYRDHEESRWYWLSIVAFLFGLLSKVSVITLPALFLLIDWWEGRLREQGQVKRLLPFGALCIFFLVIALIGKSRVIGSSGLAMDLFLPSKSTLFYLWKIAVPVNFSVIYPQNEILTFSSPMLLATVAVIAMILALTLFSVLTGRLRTLGFALAWYVLLLIPSYSTFLKNGFLYFASDRYAYLASIGVFFLLASVLVWVWRRARGVTRSGFMVLLGFVILSLPFLVARQARAWADSNAMYRNVLRIYPESAMAHNNLGRNLEDQGKIDEAMAEYRRSIEIDPHQSIPYFNIAARLGKEGKLEEQLKTYQTIIDIVQITELARPSELQKFFWLEGKFDQLGRREDAMRLLRRLIELAPEYPELHARIGIRLKNQGDHAGALVALEEAEKRGSKDPNVYYHLAELYSESERIPDIVRVLERAVQLDPANQNAKAQLERFKAIAR